ncbi:MAG: putative quinol monooxygenase [Actinomycetes bacterium]|jgi:quinol monooxygenase YgiN
MGGSSGSGPASGADTTDGTAEPEVCLVVGTYCARPGTEEALAAVLARYTVVTRTDPGCRNVDLTGSMLHPGRFVIVEKWIDAEAQRRHYDGPEMVAMAEAAVPLLATPPELDLTLGISAHDLA